MLSRSRTPSPSKSPSKSPKRPALCFKDSNIRQPLSKAGTPQLSPLKTQLSRSRPPSKPSSRASSPPKQEVSGNFSASFKNKSIPQLGFTIFSDEKDYSTELQISSSLKISSQDENDITHDKENIYIDPKNRSSTSTKRKVLSDLSIAYFPGFVKHLKPSSVSQEVQLDVTWTNEKRIRIPPYVTPPRSDRTKYVSFENEKVQTLKRSNSQSDLDSSKVVKKLVFDIHKD